MSVFNKIKFWYKNIVLDYIVRYVNCYMYLTFVVLIKKESSVTEPQYCMWKFGLTERMGSCFSFNLNKYIQWLRSIPQVGIVPSMTPSEVHERLMLPINV